MQWKIPAGVTLALAALLIPAAPAVAASPSVTAASCQAVIVYTDVRTLIAIDLDTASDTEIRILAAQILTVANADKLPVLAGALQKQLGGTQEELRAFLKVNVRQAWTVDLRIAVTRTLTNAGPHVQAAAQQLLGAPSVDAYLAYLNHGLYLARAYDAGSVTEFTDVRTLIGIDLDAASDTEIRVLAAQILTVANTEKLPVLAGALQKQLGGTPEDLRAFIKVNVRQAWTVDLRIAIARTLTTAGPYVQAAAQETLNTATIDAYLTYLNHGLFIARARDCAL